MKVYSFAQSFESSLAHAKVLKVLSEKFWKNRLPTKFQSFNSHKILRFVYENYWKFGKFYSRTKKFTATCKSSKVSKFRVGKVQSLTQKFQTFLGKFWKFFKCTHAKFSEDTREGVQSWKVLFTHSKFSELKSSLAHKVSGSFRRRKFKVSNLSGVFFGRSFEFESLSTRKFLQNQLKVSLTKFTSSRKFLKHFEDFSSSRKKFQTENVYSLTKLSQTLLQFLQVPWKFRVEKFIRSHKIQSEKSTRSQSFEHFSKFSAACRIKFQSWKVCPLTKFPNIFEDFSSSQKKFQTENVHPLTNVSNIICKFQTEKLSPSTKVFFSIICKFLKVRRESSLAHESFLQIKSQSEKVKPHRKVFCSLQVL